MSFSVDVAQPSETGGAPIAQVHALSRDASGPRSRRLTRPALLGALAARLSRITDRLLRGSNCQPAFRSSGCKAAIEGRDGSVCLLGGQEDAAVRQCEVRLGPQEGKAHGCVLGQMWSADGQLIEGRDGVVKMAGPGRSDEHLGDREGAGDEHRSPRPARGVRA